MKIKNNKKNRDILDSIFRNAPKTYEEALAKGHIPAPIQVGRKYKDELAEKEIVISLIDKHENQLCDCNENNKCIYIQLVNCEISIEKVIQQLKIT